MHLFRLIPFIEYTFGLLFNKFLGKLKIEPFLAIEKEHKTMSHCQRNTDSDWNTIRAHSRASKKNLKKVWCETKGNESKYVKLGSFEKIYASMRKQWKEGNSGIRGVGPLTCYDLCMYICKKYSISLNDRVWLMGYGPQRAANELKIWKGSAECKKCNITGESYVMLKDVVAAFQKSTFEYDKEKVKNGNEDDVESYMCCWENELRKKD